MSEYEKNKESIEKINSMKISSAFRQLFDELVEAMKNGNKVKCWAMMDNLYPSVKLEYELSDEEKKYVKDFLLSI